MELRFRFRFTGYYGAVFGAPLYNYAAAVISNYQLRAFQRTNAASLIILAYSTVMRADESLRTRLRTDLRLPLP